MFTRESPFGVEGHCLMMSNCSDGGRVWDKDAVPFPFREAWRGSCFSFCAVCWPLYVLVPIRHAY